MVCLFWVRLDRLQTETAFGVTAFQRWEFLSVTKMRHLSGDGTGSGLSKLDGLQMIFLEKAIEGCSPHAGPSCGLRDVAL